MAAVAPATMLCDAAPPSDQLLKLYDVPFRINGDGADRLLVEPSITVVVKGVTAVLAPIDRDIPCGLLFTVIGTVRGSSRRVTVVVAPVESVAVSFRSRYAGYSWSGAKNDPEATPVNVCSWWAWHADGQCWRTASHDSALAGSGPSCGSVADPVKEIGSPTFQVKPF